MHKEQLDYVLGGTLMGGTLALPTIAEFNQYLVLVGGVLGIVLVLVRIYNALWGKNGS
jgi:hypothetical protein